MAAQQLSIFSFLSPAATFSQESIKFKINNKQQESIPPLRIHPSQPKPHHEQRLLLPPWIHPFSSHQPTNPPPTISFFICGNNNIDNL
jgi:hypothetical protein